jgi:hypothetical protein
VKHSELEDGDQLVTRTELREIVLSIREDISALRETIRTKWWIPIAVALVTMLGTTTASICAAILLRR